MNGTVLLVLAAAAVVLYLLVELYLKERDCALLKEVASRAPAPAQPVGQDYGKVVLAMIVVIGAYLVLHLA